MSLIAWHDAWQEALYGAGGFYRRPEGPAGHFRTASHAAPRLLAAALHELARRWRCTAIVDVGAGRGELLTALAASFGPGERRSPGALAASGVRPLRLHGVDVVARPPNLPASIGWSAGLDTVAAGTLSGALVVAWELLDVVPCPVLEVDDQHRLRVVMVDPATGRESLGEPAGPALTGWSDRWWPLPAGQGDHGDHGNHGDDEDDGNEGLRVEVGTGRDDLWADLVRRTGEDGGGVLLAVDYAHTRQTRPPLGSLSGFRGGRQVPPVPDGACDITAHVAIDAVEAAGRRAGAAAGAFTTQHAALRDLGVSIDAPGGAELLDPGALGGFSWLVQQVSGPRLMR